MRCQLTAAIALLYLVPTPMLAQETVMAGIAVAQAPEAGLGVCLGLDAAGTMECAQNECMEQSGLGELDCAVNLWCYPHGWTAQIAVMHTEGIHWTKVVCDQNNREQLDAAVAFYCNDKAFMECVPVRIWDPQGTAVLDFD